MHHIEPNRLARQLAQHGIRRLNDETGIRLPSAARPAPAHWASAHAAAPDESTHDFLVLGTQPLFAPEAA